MRTAAVASVILATACGGPSNAPTTVEPTDVPADVPLPAGTPACEALATAPVTDAKLHMAIALDAPGDEPRRALRYTPEDGARAALAIEQLIDFDHGGGPQQVPFTTVHLVHDVQTDGPDAIAHRFVLERTDLDPRGLPQATVDALAAELDASRCGSITVRTDARGGWLGTTLAGANPSGAQALQPLEEVLLAFPAEPIGVGASWRVTTQRDVNGVVVDLETVVDLVGLDGDTATLQGAVFGTAGPQTVDAGGVRLDIDVVRIARVIEVEVDLRTLRIEGGSRGGTRLEGSSEGQPVVFEVLADVRVYPE